MRFIVRCALCGTEATAEQYVTPGRLTCPTCPDDPSPPAPWSEHVDPLADRRAAARRLR